MSIHHSYGPWQPFAAPLGLDLNDELYVDPYLVWAEATGYAGYPDTSDTAGLPVLLDFTSALERAPESALKLLAEPELELALRASRVWGDKSRYHTVFVRQQVLPVLVTLQRLGFLLRFQLGAARGRPVSAGAGVHNLHIVCGAPIQTLGIVDDGCCLAHGAFRSVEKEGHQSRFAFVWDQNPQGPFPLAWLRYNSQYVKSAPVYGGELSGTVIGNLLEAYPLLGEEGERELYRAIKRGDWGSRDRIHGACVLHALAGKPTYLPSPPPSSGFDASTLPIIFVQLPNQTAADTSGGSVGFYVLDAVRYIIQRTVEISHPQTDWSTTINVSLGSLGGPHDGTTIVEYALDEAASLNHGAVRIVLAAGNAAGRNVHAVREVHRKQPGRFDIMVPPGNERESFVELWPQLANGADVDKLRIHVRAPDGSVLRGARVGSIQVLRNRRGVVVASLVFARAVAQGLRGPMILLATRATEIGDGPEDTAPFGVWSVSVESALTAPIAVHAWVERNDTIIRRRSGQRTVFVDEVAPGECGGYLSDDSTLSSIANGEGTVCVGAFEIDRLRVADHSSNGPTLGGVQVKPDMYGASDVSATLSGIACPGFFTGTRARLSGTSAAAPRVARWIAEGADCAKTILLDPGNSTTAKPGPVGIGPISEVEGMA